MANIIGSQLSDLERGKLLHRARRNLWWLATEILGRDKLTDEFHKPLYDAQDEMRRARRLAPNAAHKNDHQMWPRDYFKTTMRECQAVQDYLWDPANTRTIWWHNVETKAQLSGNWVGRQFQENKELRRLWPDMMPSAQSKKFVGIAGEFRFRANTHRAPSMQCYGVGSEATGGHGNIGVLDDPIGLNTIADNAMPHVRRWLGSTVANVIETRGRWLRGSGTHWDEDDIFMDWRKSRDWAVTLRACFETDGKPDWKGEPVLYTREEIESKRRQMSDYEFSCQMMNDPLPAHARAWITEQCEHYASVGDFHDRPGRTFVLSDPAPTDSGGLRPDKEKQRGDGSKDWWSLAVVRLYTLGQMQVIVLLHGERSQDLTSDAGCERSVDLAMRWQSDLIFHEAYGGLAIDYSDKTLNAARKKGCRLVTASDGRLPRFVDSYSSGSKNGRIESLISRAKRREVVIAREMCPGDFLFGNGESTGFLTQARKFRVIPGTARNVLKWDDDLDVVARATDAALQEFAPQPLIVDPFEDVYSARDSASRCRYISL